MMSSSELELVPITSQKHDPAWKHCQMFKNGEKVQLKCAYCGKMFKGGGIHRIKEHLAGHKGNASTCLCVPPDVRALMQQSLDGVVVKKRKKQKISEDVTNVGLAACDLDTSANHYDGVSNEGLHVVRVLNDIEPSSSLVVNTSVDKKKRRRGKHGINADPETVVVNSTGLGAKRMNDHVHMAIARFLYDIGAPLDSVNSVYYQPMVDAITSGGPGIAPPSYHDLRGWILKNSVEEVKKNNSKLMSGWGKTGSSILVNQQITESGIVFLNFMVYCPEGKFFLKSVDASIIINSADDLFELLRQTVEEVGVRDVIQVISNKDDDSTVAVRNRLMEYFPNLYFTSCASCCLDSILDDLTKLEWIKGIIEQARSITRFVYNHKVVLNMMKTFTFGNDIVDPGPTRCATNFTTLKQMVDLKHSLEAMVNSQEWVDSVYSKIPEGKTVLDIISDQSFWSSSGLIVQLVDPLLRVLRLVNSEKRPAMGYVYAGIYRAKETIKKELVNRDAYIVYWNIIDRWWKEQLHHPLHAAGFYLNPKFFYSTEGDMHDKILSRVLDCIEKLVPDANIQDNITRELSSYKNAVGDFGRKMSIRARDTLLPAEWWSTYGGSCPNLARLAIRILSQPCSSTGYKGNRIPLQLLHESKNCLERQWLSDLVFVQYNLRLQQMGGQLKERDITDPLSLDGIINVEDWVTGAGQMLEEEETSNMMALDLISANTMLLGPLNDDLEELGAGFDDVEIFDSMMDTEEENVEENIGE